MLFRSVDFVISNGPEKKTYKVKVSGSISTKDEDLIGVTVTVKVYINDSEGTHEVYSTTEAGDSIEVGGALGGLANNNGTVSYTVTTADGMDVSSSYSNSLTVNYEEE